MFYVMKLRIVYIICTHPSSSASGSASEILITKSLNAIYLSMFNVVILQNIFDALILQFATSESAREILKHPSDSQCNLSVYLLMLCAYAL